MSEMPTAGDIGGRLKAAREGRGLTHREIAGRTKISLRCLADIERNEFARLPGGIFRRAYIRAVAIEVGLDADTITRDYCRCFEGDSGSRPARPAEVGHRVSTAFLVGLGALALLTGLLLLAWSPGGEADRVEGTTRPAPTRDGGGPS